MTRTEENKQIVNKMMKLSEENPIGTFEHMTVIHLGIIGTMLADISKSLAVIADKIESEEER